MRLNNQLFVLFMMLSSALANSTNAVAQQLYYPHFGIRSNSYFKTFEYNSYAVTEIGNCGLKYDIEPIIFFDSVFALDLRNGKEQYTLHNYYDSHDAFFYPVLYDVDNPIMYLSKGQDNSAVFNAKKELIYRLPTNYLDKTLHILPYHGDGYNYLIQFGNFDITRTETQVKQRPYFKAFITKDTLYINFDEEITIKSLESIQNDYNIKNLIIKRSSIGVHSPFINNVYSIDNSLFYMYHLIYEDYLILLTIKHNQYQQPELFKVDSLKFDGVPLKNYGDWKFQIANNFSKVLIYNSSYILSKSDNEKLYGLTIEYPYNKVKHQFSKGKLLFSGENSKRLSSEFAYSPNDSLLYRFDLNGASNRLLNNGENIIRQYQLNQQGNYDLVFENETNEKTMEHPLGLETEEKINTFTFIDYYSLKKTYFTVKDNYSYLNHQSANFTLPNGKIYLGSNYFSALTTIQYPNKVGAKCGLVWKHMPLKNSNNVLMQANILEPRKFAHYTYKNNCDSSTVLLADTGQGFNSFKWYLYDSLLAEGVNANIQFKKEGNYFVSLEAKTTTGYTSWYSDTVTAFYKKPVANFNLAQSYCKGNTVEISNKTWSSRFAKKDYQTQWYVNDEARKVNGLLVIPLDSAGSMRVKLVVKRAECTDSLERKTLVNDGVQFYKKPNINICAPDSQIQLPYSFQTPCEISDFSSTTLQWKKPYLLAKVAGLHYYQFTATAEDGCKVKIRDSIMAFNSLKTYKALQATLLQTFNNSLAANFSIKQDTFQSYSYELHTYNELNGLTTMKTTTTEHLNISLQNAALEPYLIHLKVLDKCGIALTSANYQQLRLQYINNDNEHFELQNSRNSQSDLSCNYLFKNMDSSHYATIACNEKANYNEAYFDKWIQAKIWSTDSVQYISNSIYSHYEPRLYIPNAITINGDGLNEEWLIQGIGIKQMEGALYNRWGSKVHEFKQDGYSSKQTLALTQGVYQYIIQYTDTQNKKHQIEGRLLILK